MYFQEEHHWHLMIRKQLETQESPPERSKRWLETAYNVTLLDIILEYKLGQSM